MLAVALLCIGASLGAVARWQLSLWLNSGTHWLPAGTLVANLAGGWLIGLLVAIFQAHPGIDPLWRLALVTGFLGALTTFSTFSMETVTLLLEERFGQAFRAGGAAPGGVAGADVGGVEVRAVVVGR
jgi:CrcB protein